MLLLGKLTNMNCFGPYYIVLRSITYGVTMIKQRKNFVFILDSHGCEKHFTFDSTVMRCNHQVIFLYF